jgi:hypothetical protein
MENLKLSFKRHGLRYSLLKRNDHLAVFGVSGTFTDIILHYEVVMLRIRADKYGHRVSIPSDEEFGKSKLDRHFQKLAEAEAYFASWTARLMQGVIENTEKVVTHHQKERPYILDKSA